MNKTRLKNNVPCLSVMAAALLLTVAGCTMTPPPSLPPQLTFEQVTPVSVNAAQLEISDSYRAPMTPPNVDHLFRQTPAAATRQLLKKQIRTTGRHGRTLRVVIEEASVKRQALMPEKKLWEAFIPRESERFEAAVSVRFELVDDNAAGALIGTVRVTASRSKTLLDNASLADRERAYFHLNEDLMKDLSEGIAAIVPRTFANR